MILEDESEPKQTRVWDFTILMNTEVIHFHVKPWLMVYISRGSEISQCTSNAMDLFFMLSKAE